jgi:uncharacterized protein (DUF1800 family)
MHMRIKPLISALALSALYAISMRSAIAQVPNVPGTTIIEYLHAESNKFYMSAIPAEWTLLDSNPQYGWRRTGITFSAAAQGQTPGAQPVCRYYIVGAGSHFFSIDPTECALVAGYPQLYQNEGIGWYAIAKTTDTCPADTAGIYRVYNNGAALGKASNHRYIADYSFYQSYLAQGYALEGLKMCVPLSNTEKNADASRLLYQASFGARPSDIGTVVSQGTNQWINAQLNLPSSKYTPRNWVSISRPDTCVNSSKPPLTAESYCLRDNYSLFLLQKEFFQQAINNPDQLRQRVAWALSQFFVTSGVDVQHAYGMIDYQQMLRDEAFSNFRTLLSKVTLHGAMGRFLDMANNQKPDAARGIAPNENYAREVMQLFSIGLYQLNNDGTFKRDAGGVALDAFNEDDVESLAHVFTGWAYPTVPGQTPNAGANPNNNKGYMEERASRHDFTQKTLLGKTIASNLSQSQRLDAALDAIFVHPNVPPFVSRFLIQQMVTGDPSPSYVDRVAKVFQNNGAGVRGDMKAVTRAVLTDVEARGAEKWAPSYGHLSEPVLKLTRLARAMNATTDGLYFRGATAGAGQNVFYAPSVFNYFPPDYALSKSGVNAPEFAIYNTSTALSHVNTAYSTIYGTIAPDATVIGATGTQFNLAPYTSVANDANALLDHINEIIFANRMTAKTRGVIKTAIDAVPASDATARVRMALYLSIAAPESQVLR